MPSRPPSGSIPLHLALLSPLPGARYTADQRAIYQVVREAQKARRGH